MFKQLKLYGLMLLVTGSQFSVAQILEINGEIFRDPTQPPGAVFQEEQASSFEEVPRINISNFKLSFVRSGGINPVAVINDQTVTEGDLIDGVAVARIRPGAVVLVIEGDEHVLNLFERPLRQALE